MKHNFTDHCLRNSLIYMSRLKVMLWFNLGSKSFSHVNWSAVHLAEYKSIYIALCVKQLCYVSISIIWPQAKSFPYLFFQEFSSFFNIFPVNPCRQACLRKFEAWYISMTLGCLKMVDTNSFDQCFFCELPPFCQIEAVVHALKIQTYFGMHISL